MYKNNIMFVLTAHYTKKRLGKKANFRCDFVTIRPHPTNIINNIMFVIHICHQLLSFRPSLIFKKQKNRQHHALLIGWLGNFMLIYDDFWKFYKKFIKTPCKLPKI